MCKFNNKKNWTELKTINFGGIKFKKYYNKERNLIKWMDHNLPQVFSETTDSILLVLEYNNAIFCRLAPKTVK